MYIYFFLEHKSDNPLVTKLYYMGDIKWKDIGELVGPHYCFSLLFILSWPQQVHQLTGTLYSPNSNMCTLLLLHIFGGSIPETSKCVFHVVIIFVVIILKNMFKKDYKL